MANELQHTHNATGETLYGVIRNSSGQVWNTTGTPAFETQVNANWVSGEYDIVMAESPADGYFYVGDLPASDMGTITVAVYLKIGASHAVSDPIVGTFSQFAWDGSVQSPTDCNVTHVNGVAVVLATEFDADLVKILGSSVSETSAGRTAGNWEFFWDNGDAQTAKTVNDVGGAGSSGSGARTVTVTVDDGVTVLENATVRLTEGANTFTGLTNASGVVVFSLDDATYTVSISKAGYTFTPTTKIVNGTEADTYSMTAVTITAPPNASTTTGTMTVYDEQGSVESGVTITVQVIDGPGTAGIGYDSTEWAATSNGSGVVEFAGIILGARYKIWRGTSKPEAQTFTAPTTGTSFDLAEVIGRG
jgi:hypothetical protein